MANTTRDKKSKARATKSARSPLVSLADMAKLCSTPIDTVRKWPSQGCPLERRVVNGTARPMFNPTAVKEWLAARGGVKGRGRPSALDGAAGDVKERLALAELRKKLAQAERAEMDLAARKGKLLDAGEVEQGRLARIAIAKATLLSLPARVAPVLEGRGAREIEAELDAEMRRVLEEFSRG